MNKKKEELREVISNDIATLKLNEEKMSEEQKVQYAGALTKLRNKICNDTYHLLIYELFDDLFVSCMSKEEMQEYSLGVVEFSKTKRDILVDLARKIIPYGDVLLVCKDFVASGLMTECDDKVLRPIFDRHIEVKDGVTTSWAGILGPEGKYWFKKAAENVYLYYNFLPERV